MIHVTKTFLPDQEAYQAILKKAWDNCWITNRGDLVKELEKSLESYLDTKHIIATTNGTLPIQMAIKALDLKGEIITTPFSYVATTASIVWEHCKPVFADIDPKTLTIDASRIEDAITEQTSAILATHVFGNPCDVEAIHEIATKHDLKVIYDAAHSFGVTYKNQSIFDFGDISTCSFHATKLFHTGEGGAVITKDKTLYDTLYYHHNFGHDGQENYFGLGINAKMSELQAAMGLALLPHMNTILNDRKRIVDAYNAVFKNSSIQTLQLRPHTRWNYSYYPILLTDEKQMWQVKQSLEKQQIYPRRYFYPSLDTLPYVQSHTCKVSQDVASRILCLPLFVGLKDKDVQTITNTVIESIC